MKSYLFLSLSALVFAFSGCSGTGYADDMPVKELSEFGYITVTDDSMMLSDWESHYVSELGWDVDFSDVLVSKKPEGNYRLLVIAKGLTMNQVWNSWKFPKASSFKNLDEIIAINSRNADKGHYAIWVKNGLSPDTEFLGFNVAHVDPDMKIGITLLERMVFESKHYAETGRSLDRSGGTFCSGSRTIDGGIPSVGLGDNVVRVNSYTTSVKDESFGVRAVALN